MNGQAAPDWSLVHFDVPCARCGHDLRGQDEPRCPACELDFDWSEAVPLEQLTCGECGYHLYGLSETRCPECGTGFTWEGALASFRRGNINLFEHHWRRRPFRSFFRSYFSSIRPGRLWHKVSIHDKPPVRGLWMLAIVSFLMALMMGLGVSIATFVALMLAFDAQGFGTNRTVTQYLADAIGDVFQPGDWLRISGVIVLWCACRFGALMIFRQSMRRYRVRNDHVLRVWVYAVPLMLVWLPVSWAILAVPWITSLYFRLGQDQEWLVVMPVFIHAGLVTHSLSAGYKHYLKMDHSLGVAISVEVIAVLATILVLVGPIWFT